MIYTVPVALVCAAATSAIVIAAFLFPLSRVRKQESKPQATTAAEQKQSELAPPLHHLKPLLSAFRLERRLQLRLQSRDVPAIHLIQSPPCEEIQIPRRHHLLRDDHRLQKPLPRRFPASVEVLHHC